MFDRPLRRYLWLAFGITWGVGGIALLAGDITSGGAKPLHPLHYIAAFGPTIAGFLMAGRTDGREGLVRLLARARPRLSSLPWYLAVAVLFPGVNLIAARLFAPASLAALPSWDRLVYLFPLTVVVDTGPLGEEFGWRGFALPPLLDRQRPLVAALTLGVIWWAWHLPTFFIPALSQSQLPVALFLFNSVALSVVMTWLYLRTGGDLLLMIIVHVAANYCGAIGIPFSVEVATEVAFALLILGAGGLRGARSMSADS